MIDSYQNQESKKSVKSQNAKQGKKMFENG